MSAAKRKSTVDHGDDLEFEALLEFIKQSRGFDFTAYKRTTLQRRVVHRMRAIGQERFGDYQDHLEVDPEEFSHLFNTILINVTSFFRDPEAWDYLAAEIIPQIVTGRSERDPIRVWTAGCSSGQEACTLAMLLAEAMGDERFRRQVKIFATDVDEEALAQARFASYDAEAIKGVPAKLREKYLELTGDRYVFRKDLRRSIIFGLHDLTRDAPISHLDLLLCRNTLMYFNAEAQAKILARFHFALRDDGYIFLGKAEMLLTHANLFRPVNLKSRVFLKVPKEDVRDRMLILAQAGNPEASNRLAPTARLRDAAFNVTPTAQIVVDPDGNLVMANDEARLIFSLHARDVGRPFQDLELSYRPIELRSLIERAYAERRTVRVTNVERPFPDGEVQYLDVRVVPLADDGGGFLGASVVFIDVTRYNKLQMEVERSRQDLETANEELQSTNEELETTNEELQSTVEELETTNEELQSTNEELETMNEELQSTNEELQTINEELHQRTTELNLTNAFLESVLDSMRDVVIVLDGNLNIQRWNRRAEDLWGLRTDEVQGQPFLSLDIGLPVDRLKKPLRAWLSGKSPTESEVLDATTRRGKVVECHVTGTALVDGDGETRGVILRMEDQPHEGSESR
jgi:two-component system CheB/CheR fusion protein